MAHESVSDIIRSAKITLRHDEIFDFFILPPLIAIHKAIIVAFSKFSNSTPFGSYGTSKFRPGPKIVKIGHVE